MKIDPFIQQLESIVLPISVAKVERLITIVGDRFPSVGTGGHYQSTDNQDWLASFWSGLVWLTYAVTGEAHLRRSAEAMLPSFERRLTERIRLNHDLGFLFTLSGRAAWQFAGDEHARHLALRASHILEARYNNPGRYLQAWGEVGDPVDAGRMIIDSMMNLPLLFWAAHEIDAPYLYDIACAHAHTSMRYLIRPDYSANHCYDFDPISGAPLRAATHQGYADDSLWARGQAWAIYGFAVAAAWTQDPAYLNTAARAAERYLAETDIATLPRWDFRLPSGVPAHPDSSAAAIAAGGLLRLAVLMDDARFRQAGTQILHTLVDQAFDVDPATDGLLLHGTLHGPKGIGIDGYTIFGDYFFLEAILLLLARAPELWAPAVKQAALLRRV